MFALRARARSFALWFWRLRSGAADENKSDKWMRTRTLIVVVVADASERAHLCTASDD